MWINQLGSGMFCDALNSESRCNRPQPGSDALGVAKGSERPGCLERNFLPYFLDIALVEQLAANRLVDGDLKVLMEFAETLPVSSLRGENQPRHSRFLFRFRGGDQFFLRSGWLS